MAKVFRVIVAIAFTAALFGCGGGGGSSPPAPALGQVRFVNAATDLGDVDFEMGAVKVKLAPRQSSDLFSAAPGLTPLNYTVRGVTTSSSAFLIEGRTRVVMLKNTPIGPFLSIGELDRKNTRVVYEQAANGFPSVDVYLTSPGATIATATPTFSNAQWNGSTFVPIADGTYVVSITPAGKKTVLFQSPPTEMAAGADTMILGVPASKGVRTPLPLLLTASDVRSLEDARPTVRVLKSATPDSYYSVPWTLSIDGEALAVVPDAIGDAYHLSRGDHSFSMVSSDGLQFIRQDFFVGSDVYIQRFGLYGYVLGHPGTFNFPLNTWLAPESADGPPLPGRARVRLVLSNCCRGTDLRVNGQLYAASGMAGAWILDPEPSDLRIDLTLPGSTQSEGSRTLTLLAGHYYIVNIYDPVGPDGYATVYANPAVAVPRVFNIATD